MNFHMSKSELSMYFMRVAVLSDDHIVFAGTYGLRAETLDQDRPTRAIGFPLARARLPG